MASQFNQFDWYWKVMDTNPSTQVYGTKPGGFVALADVDYVAWLAKDGGNTPTTIDTYMPSLCGVINNFAIANYSPSTKGFTLVGNVTLTNPPPNLITFTNNTGALIKIIMPVANAPNSIPVGIPIVFRNYSVGAGAFAVGIYTSDGTTVLSGLAGSIEPGMSVTAVPTGNANKLGGWDVRNSGTISAAGVPVVSQYARWASQYTQDSVPPSTVRSDIQAYAVTGGILTGNPIVQKSNPALILMKSASGQMSFIDGNLSGNIRWRMCLGDATAESGSNAGSDFSLQRYTDAAVAIDFPLTINRATALTTLTGNVGIVKTSPILALDKASNGQQARLEGKTNTSLRWTMLLGDEFNESGSNAGSSFRLDAYDDAGAFRFSPLTIGRNTGAAVFYSDVTVSGNLNVIGTVSGRRELLTASRNYYVNNTTGADTNTGLAVGVPFKTIQKAIDTACGLDTGIFGVIINVADGTYAVTGTVMVLKTITGAGTISIIGNPTTPTNCVIAATSGFPVYAPSARGQYTINGFHLRALTAGYDNVLASGASYMNITNVRFEGLNAHLHASLGATIIVNNGNGISIAGNFNIHIFCDSHSIIQEVSCTITMVGTPAIGQAWAWVLQGGLVITNANTYGACTGTRYYVASQSYVNTGTSGSPTYFPGDANGSVVTGGIYD